MWSLNVFQTRSVPRKFDKHWQMASQCVISYQMEPWRIFTSMACMEVTTGELSIIESHDFTFGAGSADQVRWNGHSVKLNIGILDTIKREIENRIKSSSQECEVLIH